MLQAEVQLGAAAQGEQQLHLGRTGGELAGGDVALEELLRAAGVGGELGGPGEAGGLGLGAALFVVARGGAASLLLGDPGLQGRAAAGQACGS